MPLSFTYRYIFACGLSVFSGEKDILNEDHFFFLSVNKGNNGYMFYCFSIFLNAITASLL